MQRPIVGQIGNLTLDLILSVKYNFELIYRNISMKERIICQ